MKFEKYHGIGNDFIFIKYSYLKNFKSISELKNFSESICNRHYGIGADGVIFFRIQKKIKRYEILIVNSDGSFGATCGNALRCFGLKLFREKIWSGKKQIPVFRLNIAKLIKFSKDKNEISQDELFVHETKNSFSTLLKVEGYQKNKHCAKISILFEPQKEISSCGNPFMEISRFRPIFVQLENPHLVFISKDFHNFSNEQYIQFGKEMQKNLNANIGMLELNGREAMDGRKRLISMDGLPQDDTPTFQNNPSKKYFNLRVFERGAGLTLACGSGAVAAALALRFANHFSQNQNKILFKMPGGFVEVFLPRENNEKIVLSAEAQFIFKGANHCHPAA